MYCGQCGTLNDDGAKFCKKCGAALYGTQNINGYQHINDDQYINEGQSRKKEAADETDCKYKRNGIGKLAAGIMAAVVIICAVIVAMISLPGKGYKAVVDRMVEAVFKPDAKAIVELIPEKLVDDEIEKGAYEEDGLDQLCKELNEELREQLDSIEKYLGKDWKLSYEIQETEDITGQELDGVKEKYKEVAIKISAAKKVKVEFIVKADETDISNSMDIWLIKVGRSWYLDALSMNDFF